MSFRIQAVPGSATEGSSRLSRLPRQAEQGSFDAFHRRLQELAERSNLQTPSIAAAGAQSSAAQPSGATGVVTTALDALSGQFNDADKLVVDLASGRSQDIHSTMIALERADIGFRFISQVRNRALTAYQEIMRLQV